jgi:rod shape determining protein RodA
MQSRIAVGSGAVFGKGYKKGTQTQLRFLPEQTTDFVFSVLAEEWGFVGSAIAISLYLFLVHHLFSLATRFDDMYCFYVTIGTASLIFWHMFINIGMVIGVLPVVGITLALFSYGGSSLITTMCLLGMVAGFSARRYMFS